MTTRNTPRQPKQSATEVDRPGFNVISRREALRSVGAVVYAVRLDQGVIKIGWTADLADRLYRYGRRDTIELLGFIPGTMADEQLIHSGLVEHRAHGHEYYAPRPEVLEVVNDMREHLHLPPLAA